MKLRKKGNYNVVTHFLLYTCIIKDIYHKLSVTIKYLEKIIINIMIFKQIIFFIKKKVFFYGYILDSSEYFSIDVNRLLKCEIFQINWSNYNLHLIRF